jgi:hypothetical protein
LLFLWLNSYGAVSAFCVGSLSILASISGNIYANFNNHVIICYIETVLQHFGKVNFASAMNFHKKQLLPSDNNSINTLCLQQNPVSKQYNTKEWVGVTQC